MIWHSRQYPVSKFRFQYLLKFNFQQSVMKFYQMETYFIGCKFMSNEIKVLSQEENSGKFHAIGWNC